MRGCAAHDRWIGTPGRIRVPRSEPEGRTKKAPQGLAIELSMGVTEPAHPGSGEA